MADADKKGLFEKLIGDKRRWRAYRARVKRLPAPYRTTVHAIERYLMYVGGVTDGESAASLLEDVADLFEQAAADGTPVRAVVGEDPVEFVEELVRNYPKDGYLARERDRLNKAVENASRQQK